MKGKKVYLRFKLVVEEEILKNTVETFSDTMEEKNIFKKGFDGETLFSCNICNEGVHYEHSIKLHIYYKHEDHTLDILNSDEHTDAEEVKCVKVIRNSTGLYNSASLHCLGILKYLTYQIIGN